MRRRALPASARTHTDKSPSLLSIAAAHPHNSLRRLGACQRIDLPLRGTPSLHTRPTCITSQTRTVPPEYEISLDANTDWWRKYFKQYKPVEYQVTSTPFEVDPSTQYNKAHGIIGSLMCPSRDFQYQ